MKSEPCSHLHEDHTFTVRVYQPGEPIAAFKTWYEGIFLKQNPNCDDFSFQDAKTISGEPTIEVMAFNPFFPIDALEAMFHAARAPTKAAVKNLKVLN